MAYVCTKTKKYKGNTYSYDVLVQSVREGDKVRQIMLKYLGTNKGGMKPFPVSYVKKVPGGYALSADGKELDRFNSKAKATNAKMYYDIGTKAVTHGFDTSSYKDARMMFYGDKGSSGVILDSLNSFDPDEYYASNGNLSRNNADYRELYAHVEAFRTYIGTGYENINRYLRYGTLSGFDKRADAEVGIKEKIKRLDTWTQMFELPKNTTLYRARPSHKALDGHKLEDLKIGDTWTDSAFGSISASDSEAHRFLNHYSKKVKGTFFTFKNPNSKQKYGMGTDTEEELILPRNTRYRITDIRHDNTHSSDVYYIWADIITNEDDKPKKRKKKNG